MGCPAGPGAYPGADMAAIPDPDARAAPWWHLPAVSEPPEGASLPGGRLADAGLFASTGSGDLLWYRAKAAGVAVELAVGDRRRVAPRRAFGRLGAGSLMPTHQQFGIFHLGRSWSVWRG